METKNTLYDDFITLQNRSVEGINENLLFPLMRWMSGYEKNIPICREINRNFFYVDKKILLGLLALTNYSKQYIKYPKAKKFDNKKFDLVANHIKNYYKLSSREIIEHRKIIEKFISSQKWLTSFSNLMGLDNKDRKLLKVDILKFDKKKMKVSKQKKLF